MEARLTAKNGTICPSNEHTIKVPCFEARTNRITFLKGPNGCGKSSVLRALHDPVWGRWDELKWPNTRVPTQNRGHRRSVLFLPQKRRVFPELSVVDNIAISCCLPPKSVAPLFNSGVLCPLSCRRAVPAGNLCKGDQLRLALACFEYFAIQSESHGTVGLLDEPLSGCSNDLRSEVLALMRRLADRGWCLVVAEHELVQVNGLAVSEWLFSQQSSTEWGLSRSTP